MSQDQPPLPEPTPSEVAKDLAPPDRPEPTPDSAATIAATPPESPPTSPSESAPAIAVSVNSQPQAGTTSTQAVEAQSRAQVRSSPPKDETLPETGLRLLKLLTIQLLRLTIRGLEQTVTWLEAPPKPVTPRPAKAASGTRTTASIDRPLDVAPPPTPPNTPAFPPEPNVGKASSRFAPTSLLARVQQVWQSTQVWWSELLEEVRSLLPAAINQRLSTPVLTGAIAAVIIGILWTATSLIFPSAPKPTEVATVPELEVIEAPVPEPAIPPEIAAPAPEEPVTAAPAIASSPLPASTPSPDPAPPPLLLTPEQKLIASIQDQVAEISDRYVAGLIQSVQANFRSSRLTVKVGAGWYQLSQTQQDKLANEMLRRTQELDFIKLELVDPEETLLARSPVVGSEMVILKRSTAAPIVASVTEPESL